MIYTFIQHITDTKNCNIFSTN